MSADRAGLERLGYILGGITVAVFLVAGTVVFSQVQAENATGAPQANIAAVEQ